MSSHFRPFHTSLFWHFEHIYLFGFYRLVVRRRTRNGPRRRLTRGCDDVIFVHWSVTVVFSRACLMLFVCVALRLYDCLDGWMASGCLYFQACKRVCLKGSTWTSLGVYVRVSSCFAPFIYIIMLTCLLTCLLGWLLACFLAGLPACLDDRKICSAAT